jgi:hypothetical protein
MGLTMKLIASFMIILSISSCQRSEINQDDFLVVMDVNIIKTSCLIHFYDAATEAYIGEDQPTEVSISLRNPVEGLIINANGEYLPTKLSSKAGVISFGLNPYFAGIGDWIGKDLVFDVSAPGYLSSVFTVTIDTAGTINELVNLVSFDHPPSGVLASRFESTFSLANGSIEEDSRMASPDGNFEIIFKSGTKLLDEEGRPLSGKLSVEAGFFSGSDIQALKATPFGYRGWRETASGELEFVSISPIGTLHYELYDAQGNRASSHTGDPLEISIQAGQVLQSLPKSSRKAFSEAFIMAMNSRSGYYNPETRSIYIPDPIDVVTIEMQNLVEDNIMLGWDLSTGLVCEKSRPIRIRIKGMEVQIIEDPPGSGKFRHNVINHPRQSFESRLDLYQEMNGEWVWIDHQYLLLAMHGWMPDDGVDINGFWTFQIHNVPTNEPIKLVFSSPWSPDFWAILGRVYTPEMDNFGLPFEQELTLCGDDTYFLEVDYKNSQMDTYQFEVFLSRLGPIKLGTEGKSSSEAKAWMQDNIPRFEQPFQFRIKQEGQDEWARIGVENGIKNLAINPGTRYVIQYLHEGEFYGTEGIGSETAFDFDEDQGGMMYPLENKAVNDLTDNDWIILLFIDKLY